MTSFIEEDWTGLSKSQIRSMIISELEEEQQCKENGHQWTQAIYCRNCGEYFEDSKKVRKERQKELQQLLLQLLQQQ